MNIFSFKIGSLKGSLRNQKWILCDIDTKILLSCVWECVRLIYPIHNEYLDDGTNYRRTWVTWVKPSRSLEGLSCISKFHLTCTQPCQLVEVGVFESYPSIQSQRFTSRHAWGKRLAWFPISCLLPMSTDQKRWEDISNIPILFRCNSLVGFYNVVQSYDLIYLNSPSFFLSEMCI